VHTFHLNCREFFLDGLKRDRWVWGGDAYQSALVNQYLYFDPAITRRTIRALLGKPPYEQHINAINDYSAYLIIMVWDYYMATGDAEFVKKVFPRVRALYDFIEGRLDENGLVVGRPDDWVFIDWARFDREGPLCAEQILLWKVYDVMAKLSGLVGAQFSADPDALKEKIEALFWDAEKGAYIDGFVSGKRNVTRHANAFAILYDFAPEKSGLIAEHVLLNDAIDPITTPYFKFYELMALCRIGHVEVAQEMILSYWYPMLELGATTIWEQFDPREKGAEHYAMYGDPYGRSLCHAWGSGPLCLLGRYVAGVEATCVAYETFDVAPRPGAYKRFEATVPVWGGEVRVRYDDGARTLEASASRAGGTLKFRGQEMPIPANKTVKISWEAQR
jgi:alpha-L-rhamnosidase